MGDVYNRTVKRVIQNKQMNTTLYNYLNNNRILATSVMFIFLFFNKSSNCVNVCKQEAGIICTKL